MLACVRVRGSEYLYRSSVYPAAFRHKKKLEPVLVPALFFYLGDEPNDVDGTQLVFGSLAWERFAPSWDHVHAYGCRIASRRNAKLEAEGRLDPSKRNVYCGSYALKARSIRSLVGLENLAEIVSADVVHKIEDGEIAHAELQIVVQADGRDVEATKTAIIDRLWNASSGPLKHVCAFDSDLEPHPSSLLADGPGGRLPDGRSALKQLWAMALFHASRLCFGARQAYARVSGSMRA
jgi:hypothetical protein